MRPAPRRPVAPAPLPFLLPVLFLPWFVLLFPSNLLAERLLMTDGTVVEGSIVQQTRTTVQVRTPDGRTLTLDKARIRRIEYGPPPDQTKQQEEARRREEARKADEVRRREETRKAEALREAREAAEAKAEDEARRRESARLADTPSHRWLEPYVAAGSGSYRSGFEQLFALRVGTEDIASAIVNPTPTVDSPDRWTYTNTGTADLGLRGGWNRWMGELDIRTFSAETNFGHIHSDTNGTALRVFAATPLNTSVSSLQGGYALIQSGESSLYAIVGFRGSRSTASVSELGFNVTTFNVESLSAGTTLSLNTQGPQVGLGWTRPLPSWPLILSFRVSLFRATGTASIHDIIVTPDAPVRAMAVTGESRLVQTGRDLSLQALYRWKHGMDVCAEIQVLSISSTILSTTGMATNLMADGTVTPAPLGAVFAATNASTRKDARAESFSGLRLGVTKRYDW